jgi:hypothetical protein
MLTAARGVVPGLAPGKPNVEYIAMDGTLHAVPLADAARVRLTDMQPSRRFKARKGQRRGRAGRAGQPGRPHALDEPYLMILLLDSLRRVGADEQVAALASRIAAHAALDNPARWPTSWASCGR